MEKTLNILFDDNRDAENPVLLSAKFSHLQDSLVRFLESNNISKHVAFLSSGTTSANPKGYVISKEAMFNNAQAVNEHLQLDENDRWGVTLPPYHVGGLSIFFRARLLNHSPVLLYPWNPTELAQRISTENVTVISLVPTQIYDLVKAKIQAPEKLKYVLAGGDFLSNSLEQKAMELGWPIVRTFGMSEVGSQLATACSPGRKEMKILSLHQLKTDQGKRLWIKSPSLFSFEIQYQDNWILKPANASFDYQGYYPLPDKAQIKDRDLTPLGRYDGRIKSSGLLIDFMDLKEKLEAHMLHHDCWGKVDLLIKDDERKNQILQLAYEHSVSFDVILDFQQSIYPLKIDEIKSVQSIERNELGKRNIRSKNFSL